MAQFEIEKLPKGNPPKFPVDQLILVWGAPNPHMGPRDIVNPSHAAYDADIDDKDMWDLSNYYGQKFESMVNSMLVEIDGILQGIRVPISVAKDGSQDGYVVAGRWRTLAAREAQKRKPGIVIYAPFIWVPLTDAAIKRQMVLENMNGNRNLKPTRKAAYVAILESHGATREEIMSACGVCSWQAIENIKKLNELAPEVKALVDLPKQDPAHLTQTEARAIADKPQSEQKAIADRKKNQQTTGGADSDKKPDDESKRISPKDMRRIAEFSKGKSQVLSEILEYLLSGDLSKIDAESTRKIIEDALKLKKRGPQGSSDKRKESSIAAYQVQLAAVRQNGWKIRAALMEALREWEDEGQAECNNPDSPDYKCYDMPWYEEYSKMWRKDYANRDDKTQSEGAFLKEWIRNLKE